ncbi:Non-classical export protein 2 [Erysiphe necator]|nr:Non-classical export protein 2 [Erysiphe necator]
MIDVIQTSLRCSQLLWTLLCTALISSVIADSFAGNPSCINFAIFVCVLSWITCIGGMIGAFNDKCLVPMVILVLDTTTAFLSLISGIVLAAKLQVHSCEDIRYILSNSLTNGSFNPSKRCHELQAATAFMWFLFISFMGSLYFDIVNGTKRSIAGSSGSRASAPTMSQA